MEFFASLAFDENVYTLSQTYSATVQPGGEDGNTRGKDVNNSTVVGERGELVGAVGGTDGVDSGLGCGRGVASILSVVTSSNGHEDTSADSVGRSRVDGSRANAAKRHATNNAVGAAASLGVVGDEVDASNDTGVGTLHLVSKALNCTTHMHIPGPWHRGP